MEEMSQPKADDDIVVEADKPVDASAEIVIEKVEDGGADSGKPVISAEDGVNELKRRLEFEKNARIEAERRASQSAQGEFKAKADADSTNMALVDQAIGSLKAHSTSLKQALAQAMASGDWDRAADAQSEMATAAAKLQRLEDGKQAMLARPKAQAPTAVQSDPVEAMASSLTPRSAAWVRAHPEYARDGSLTRKMLAAHNLAVEDGLAPDTDDYFRAVEDTLKLRTRQKDAEPVDESESIMSDAEKPVVRRQSPPAAPVSRSGNGSGSPRVIRLTHEEQEIAAMTGLTPEQYAKNKYALQKDGRLN